jgi:ferrous iron transport protein B
MTGKNTIALLGQPNSGKSSLFNILTGSKQHVGNWPGKTVEQKEGEYTYQGEKYLVADLPGSYSLSANSDEEVITKEYIASGKADMVCIFADASQLQRSLYMLADFAGCRVPAMLLLNMMDVAGQQGIEIDTDKLSRKLGIPVLPFVAVEKKSYSAFHEAVQQVLRDKPVLNAEKLKTPDEKFKWIDELLADTVKREKKEKEHLSKFDRLATSRRWGKWIAFGILFVIFVVAMLLSGIVCSIVNVGCSALSSALRTGMTAINVHTALISLVCDVLVNVLYFASMMASFVLGITLGFNILEQTGYLARISFVFDGTMSRLGLQGKAVMPFFMGLGCTIAGTTGTRVIDNWGQKILTIAMAWAVPCAATWSIVPALAVTFFGTMGGTAVVIGILAFMVVIMALVNLVFGKKLSPSDSRVGMIMELPPYHKPRWKSLFSMTFSRTLEIFLRALRMITIVSVVFFLLSFSSTGNPADSLIYKLGVVIEPVTRFFGLGWQAFMAFVASMISKESLLGVLNTLYSGGGDMVASTFGAKAAGANVNIATILADNITKSEALAFLFAITFNMPCVSALASTAKEAHSVKWTMKIAFFYTLTALCISCIVYHVGMLIW